METGDFPWEQKDCQKFKIDLIVWKLISFDNISTINIII